MESEGNRTSLQFLVKLNNAKTHLIRFENNCQPTSKQILEKLSLKTNLPLSILRLHPSQAFFDEHSARVTFLSAFTYLPILGGKGGFGTLLKGQSKQAGAKKTLDFGACRDLNGRRLRHVNDELKLRKWREGQSASLKSSGGTREELIEQEVSRMRTASGIQNWHLMVPSWSEVGGISGKGRAKQERGWRREAERWVDTKLKEEESTERNKGVRERAVLDYVQTGEKRGAEDQAKLTHSIFEGLKKRRKTVSNDGTDIVDSENPPFLNDIAFSSSSYMYTLSGDLIVEEGKNGHSSGICVHSKSEFATGSILINPEKRQPETKNLDGVYYEVKLITGGVAQIGWATRLGGELAFKPNSSTGDGVGDDKESFGFDGCRSLIFHNGIEKEYGVKANQAGNDQLGMWQEGDILGCCLNGSAISYTLNGHNLGIAFNQEGQEARYPVFSLNENEVISVNIGPHFEHCPDNHIGINNFVYSGNTNNEGKKFEKENTKHRKSNVAKPDRNSVSKKMEKKVKSSISVPVDRYRTSNISGNLNLREGKKSQGLNLNDFKSVQQLEALGMDRLKEELYALDCKCGGSLEERAERLFSLKGLSKDDFPKKVRGKNFGQ